MRQLLTIFIFIFLTLTKVISAQMINVSPEKFKEVKTENGVIAVITIKNLETVLKGTRSEKVLYAVQVENRIIGKINEFDSIWNYGNPMLEVKKKYLVFLGHGKQLLRKNDFQRLNCDRCNDIVVACKKELSKY